MTDDGDLIKHLLRDDSGLLRMTNSYLGQNTISKISDHVLDDDKLVELIGNSNKLLKSIVDKYSQKKEKLINDEIQGEISALIFNSNYNDDKFKLQTFINKIDVLILKVTIQKNELAEYRNELKDVVQLTTVVDSNKQRLADIAGIIQYLDLKILKIENDIVSANNQITSLNKCFDVTFFHLKESIDKNTSDELYLDVMFKLSKIKIRNSQVKFSMIVLGSIFIILGIYNSIASKIEWKSEIVKEEVGVVASSIIPLMSDFLFFSSFLLLILSAIFGFYIVFNNKYNARLELIKSILLLIGISVMTFIASLFVSGSSVEKVIIGYDTYQMLNIGWQWGILYILIGTSLVVMGLMKQNNVKVISEKQTQIYKLCKGK